MRHAVQPGKGFVPRGHRIDAPPGDAVDLHCEITRVVAADTASTERQDVAVVLVVEPPILGRNGGRLDPRCLISHVWSMPGLRHP